MKILKKIIDVLELRNRIYSKNKILGFVPTMGALHDGHISLIRRSVKENDYTIVSIFVNPTQFNDKNDLENYPRTEERDIKMLENAGCDFAFLPDVIEMYPESDNKIFDFDGIDMLMEGKHRKGHFNGVAQIVYKFFDLISPNKAYFGKKDFQQLAIIQLLVKKYMNESGIEVIPCEIVREEDGLAMSSRNLLLSEEHRKVAPLIHKVLKDCSNKYNDILPEEIERKVISDINSNKLLKVEYFEIVDNSTLLPAANIIPGETTGCIAVYAGNIRLIDNITF